MGHQGQSATYRLLSFLHRILTYLQQLLEIWNKAKGKERDAMLWGDEVPPLSSPELPGTCRLT